jgi:site-specific recombinase XerD
VAIKQLYTYDLEYYSKTLIKDLLPTKDFEAFCRIMDSWTSLRMFQLRHKQCSVQRDVGIINDFVKFSGKAPWSWKEQDFLAWSEKLVAYKEIAVSSQRHYQGVIKRLFQYMIDSEGVRTLLSMEHGIIVRQICHVETMIPHCYERELKKEKPTPDFEEMDQIWRTYDEEIDIAEAHHAKDFFPLQRDLVLFTAIYGAGLRISEALGLDTTSFSANLRRPDLGKFGMLSVWGKGSAGQGPKHRNAYLYSENHASVLEWYAKEVRPHFLRNADLNEKAFFLSERGERLRLSTAEERFKHILFLANMEGRGFTIHSLRHAHASHTSLHLSPNTVKENLGHVFLETTLDYTHIPSRYQEAEIAKAASWNQKGSTVTRYDG